MTRITRIAMQGFKSFAHKTEIPFDQTFNCVLGPNGSGKSNIGDALCFVLGRLSAKSLRAEKSGNLVFNGGKDKKPASSAMVEIAFDNSQNNFPVEASEVVISRSLKTDGTSTYRINGKKYTRSEVVELLSHAKINPDGYNIILQGDIMRFVDMSHLERRKIIEEISDVSHYDEKKQKAMLEMQKVEEKLNNAELILKERRVHLNELKKDRDQALKYKEAKGTIDNLKATVLSLHIKDREAVKTTYDQEIGQLQEKISKAERGLVSLREEVAQHKAGLQELNKELEQRGEKQQIQVHRQLEDVKVQLAQEKTRLGAVKDELHKIQQRRDQLQQELREQAEKTSMFSREEQTLQQTLQRKQKEWREVQNKISEFKKKHRIESSQELDTEIEDKDKLIDQKQEEVQKLRLRQQDLLREKDKLEYQAQTLQERLVKVQVVRKEHEVQVKAVEQLRKQFKDATLQLNQLLDQDSSFAAQTGHARQKLQALQERQMQLQVKTADAMEKSNDLLKSLRSFKGVHGTVATLGQAAPKYALPLERAAGNKLQHIIVDTDKTAAECIAHLKDKRIGQGAFIPLNKIKGQGIYDEDKKLLKQKGVHDFALNLVSFKPQFEKAFAHVFGNTLIIDDIETARTVGIGRVKMAALDGSIAEGSGVMRGGFFLHKSKVGFQEKGAVEELEKVEQEIGQLEGVLSATMLRREANERAISELRKLRAEREGEVIRLETSLHLQTDDLEASEQTQAQLGKQLMSVNEELQDIQKQVNLRNMDLAQLKSKKQLLRSQISELRNPRLLAELSAFEDVQRQSREGILRLESDLQHKKVQVEQLFAPEREKMQEIMKQQNKEEATFREERERLQKSIGEREKEALLKEKESKELYSKFHQVFEQREKLNSAIMKADNEMEKIREQSRLQERDMNLISLKNAEVKAKLAALQEQFDRFSGISLVQGKSIPQLETDIHKAETLLSQMSAVNLKALEIYEEIEKEYQSLTEKKGCLEKEKVDVLTLMNEIETKKKDHFMKTFTKANDHFQRIFSNLFKKGKAYLELDNPQQPFEDGLSVKVKFTGNRYLDIKSLSGGEKTLTALSFIFAIQEYQPASFYILDEIDAALDKHNSEMLAKLIRGYAQNAQYIVISHNDSLISEADTLFGISMQDGVSKVTSLKI